MKIKLIPFCACLCLLTACSAGHEPESIADVENAQHIAEIAETKITEPETTETEEYIEATLPAELEIPENAAYCQITHYPVDEAYGFQIDDAYVFYDEHDNEILSLNGTDENSRVVKTYEYNADGTIAVEKTEDYFEKVVLKYTYNDDQTVKQCFMQTDGVDEGYLGYEYDKYGQKKKEFFIDTRGVCMYTISYKNEYDSEGRLTRQKDKSLDALACDIQYEYDENGNVSRETTKSVLLNQVIEDSRYTYDANGRKRTEETHTGDVTVYSEFLYVYFESDQT